MKRFLRTARDIGLAAIFVRGLGRAREQWKSARSGFRTRRARRDASRLPKRAGRISLKPAKEAPVCVAILGGGDWRCINRCLASLREIAADVPAHVRVYHRPEIAGEMRMHAGVQLVPVSGDVQLARVLSDAAAYRYAYVIDPRVVPAPGALPELLATFGTDPKIAVAGSKVCTPRGTIVEAGRTVASDGSIVPCGFGAAADDSRYDFVRNVDAVSPDSFAVRLGALRNVDLGPVGDVASLCRELRERGLLSVYQPRSIVFRSASEPETGVRKTADAPVRGRTILFLDEHVPFDDRDAGSRRMASLLRWAREAGWNVLFGSRDRRGYGRYGDRLKQSGIEVWLGFDSRSLAALAARGTAIQCVWLSRPSIASEYLEPVRSAYPRARAIYDTVDLHFVRLSRQAEVEKRAAFHEALERQELAAAAASDVTVVTTDQEAAALRDRGIRNVQMVALSEPEAAWIPGYGARSGILFVGNYSHAPNVDAACFLAREVMPAVWRRNSGIELTLAGADPVRAVRRLAGPHVRVPGFVDDIAPVFAAHRVFAAPLRFGAGLKGKIVHAMASGVPVVTTPVGAEGIATTEGELAVAGDPESFADAVLQLYDDPVQWRQYSDRGRAAAAARFSPAAVARQFYSVIEV